VQGELGGILGGEGRSRKEKTAKNRMKGKKSKHNSLRSRRRREWLVRREEERERKEERKTIITMSSSSAGFRMAIGKAGTLSLFLG
jgi:hypothetical protein